MPRAAAIFDSRRRSQLEAVLGHELAHIANRDAGLMTLAGVPRTLGETQIGKEGLIFSDHPPLAKRLARLEEMTRVMGKPVGA